MRRKTPADYHALAEARGFRWLGPEVSSTAQRQAGNANTGTGSRLATARSKVEVGAHIAPDQCQVAGSVVQVAEPIVVAELANRKAASGAVVAVEVVCAAVTGGLGQNTVTGGIVQGVGRGAVADDPDCYPRD